MVFRLKNPCCIQPEKSRNFFPHTSRRKKAKQLSNHLLKGLAEQHGNEIVLLLDKSNIQSSNHQIITHFLATFLVKSDPKPKIESLIHHWTTKIPPPKKKRCPVFLWFGEGICLIRSVENAATTTTTTIGSTWLSLRSAFSEAWSASKRLKKMVRIPRGFPGSTVRLGGLRH